MYALNNPLAYKDPTGLFCVWDDGSYDSPDDPDTGGPSSCGNQGGNWFDGSPSEWGLTGDWSDRPNSDLAGLLGQTGDYTLYSSSMAFASTSIGEADFGVANNVQQRIQQIANQLKNCGGVYPLTAAVAGTFKVDSSLPSSIYAVTSQNDQLYSQTSINPNTFGNANPSTQTGVIVHEWFHTTQIDDNPFFTFMNGLSQKLPSWLGGGFMERQADAAAKQALQTCGPG